MADGLRFAFYGRVSTDDLQDPEVSRGWQRARASTLIQHRGELVEEFFDRDISRSIPWARPPRHAACSTW